MIFISYLKSAREELQKVAWPSREQVVQYTGIVVGSCVAFAAFFAGLDWVLTQGLQALLARVS